MISKHSAHSTLLPIGFRTCLWRYTYLLLLISMLWHRQAIFESKGDKLSSSAEGRIRTQDLRYLFTSRLNACWRTDWAIEDQARTHDLHSDALAQASDIRIERRQLSCLPLLKAGFEPKIYYRGPGEDRTHDLQTEATPTYMFVVVNFDASKLKSWTQQPVPMMSEHSAHLTSLPFGFRTWLWRYTCLLLLISMLWHRQAIFESKGDKLSSFAESRIRTWKYQGT